MLRPKPGELLGRQDPPFKDASFPSFFPNLAAMLLDTKYDDGNPRTTSTLLIFIEAGVLRLCLNDRDNNRSAFVTSETMDGALTALENALASGTVEWRSKRYGGGNQPATPF